MAFEGLSEKLNNVFKKLKSRGKLTEKDVKEAMREVKLALLEADVSYKVVKDFVAKVSERAVGEEVLTSLTPAQQVIDKNFASKKIAMMTMETGVFDKSASGISFAIFIAFWMAILFKAHD